jgi:UDP-3-O-[3-hydroxymyristoyl] N-acetylglucosamine deacetylase
VEHQTTLKRRVSLSGVGVHGGRPVTVHFNPADADTGIVFQRIDPGSEGRLICAITSEVGETDLCTAIGRSGGDQVATIEHLMAAVSGMGIDNLHIEIDGTEVPIMDGSAAPFVDAFLEAGIETLAENRRYIRILKHVRIDRGSSWAEFRPHDGTRFEVEIDFPTPVIGRQALAVDLDRESFIREISRARTFGFIKDVEWLWAAGFALGSTLENSVVIGEDNRVINAEGLRFPDEFVRHKTLDAVGDLALAGCRFIGCFRSYRGGHRLNATALKQLLADPSAYEVVEARKRGRDFAEIVAVNRPA